MVICNTSTRLLLTTFLFVSVTMLHTATAQEDSPALDQLTENVGIGLIARNLIEFNEEFSELCQEAQIPIGKDSMAELFYYPLREYEINVDDAIDRNGSGGLVILGGEFNQSILRYIYPVEESNLIAEAIGVDPMEFKAGSAYRTRHGELVMLDQKMSIAMPLFGGQRGPETPEPIENPFGEIGSVSKHLTESDRAMFDKADAVLMLENEVSTMFWEQVLRPMFGAPENDSDLWDRLARAGEEIRFGLAAIDMDEGVHVRSKSFFTNTTDGAAIQLIRDIRGGDSPSDLTHLPDAQVLFAGAARGNGEQNASLAKAIVKLLVEVASPNEEVLTSADKVTFYDSFEAIWKRLNGTRVGLYRNEGEVGDGGELALVTIFDVNDPAGLLASIPGLVKFANNGIERAAGGDDPDIRFEYQAGQDQIAGIQVPADVLTFDTSRMSSTAVNTLQRFFGANANQLRFVPLENHVIMFVGTNPALLKATVENLQKQKPGLAAHPAVVSSNTKLDPRRKIELHFSAKNFNYIYSAMIRERKDLGRYVRPEILTSFALVIEEDRFGFDFWIPLKELDRTVKLIMANF